MTSSEKSNKDSRNRFNSVYKDLMKNLKLIKAAEEAGIYIDGEYKNKIGKSVKIYLAKTDSHISEELHLANEYKHDCSDFEDKFRSEADEFYLKILEDTNL